MNIIKRLDVVPFHSDFADCTEECMISVANYYRRNFSLMYSQAWGFSFDENLNKSDNVGYSLNGDRGVTYELLRLYHGLQIAKVKETDAYKVKERIISELNQDKPVGVVMDTYYYSWDPNKNQHGSHTFIISGVDTQKELFYCTDPFFQKKDEILDFKDFLDGYLGIYVTVNSVNEEIKEYSWKNIINATIKKISGKDQQGENIFVKMLRYADYIEQKINFSNEVFGKRRIVDLPFYVSLEDISRGRRQYAVFLEEIASKHNINGLFEVADKLKLVSAKWDAIRGIMVKSIYNESLAKEKLPPKIREIAIFEKDIFNLMTSIVMNSISSDNQITNDMDKNILQSEDIDNSNDYTYLDLTKYFNNNGFGSILNNDTTADLNGAGLFFVTEDIPTQEIWNIGDMSFKFPKKLEGKNDNIACSEQLVEVPCVKGTNLMILATADFGSFNEIITIRYKDGSNEQIAISCTELIFEPIYGECVAWEGRACERNGNTVNIYNSRVKIFAKNYRLKKSGIIIGIELPYLPNIHIFSMTLS